MLAIKTHVHELRFRFAAGTSRGVLTTHTIVLIQIFDHRHPEVFGLGEAAPLRQLSPEQVADVLEAIPDLAERLKATHLPQSFEGILNLVNELVSTELPSLRFALECALLDLLHGGTRTILPGQFRKGTRAIPINGLIWMGDLANMRRQVDEKVQAGFGCIKLKVGALDFASELELIAYLREEAPNVQIRLDANGGFPINETLARLKTLASYGIHSIEQPIMPSQWEAMALIAAKSQVPIALDEELIPIQSAARRRELLDEVKPQYIILKPTLLGGIGTCLDWIAAANERKIGWWLTSALESNVGLNAVAQLADYVQAPGYQGLGTGQLYENNIESPLEIVGETLRYRQDAGWKLPNF